MACHMMCMRVGGTCGAIIHAREATQQAKGAVPSLLTLLHDQSLVWEHMGRCSKQQQQVIGGA